jgi:hypothetical protein
MNTDSVTCKEVFAVFPRREEQYMEDFNPSCMMI